MVTPRAGFLLLLLVLLVIAGGFFIREGMACHDREVILVSTDRTVYSMEDTVRVRILNTGDRPVSIYCPSWCALGNFPTAVEKYSGGRWEYSLGFCPSIGSPLENRGTPEGDFLRHTLPPGDTFEVELANLGSLRLTSPGSFRVVYYLCGGRQPVYSGTFTITP